MQEPHSYGCGLGAVGKPLGGSANCRNCIKKLGITTTSLTGTLNILFVLNNAGSGLIRDPDFFY